MTSRTAAIESLTFAPQTPFEKAADTIESDGAQGYLHYLSAYRLADLINEHLPEDVQTVIYAQMVKELAEHFGGES